MGLKKRTVIIGGGLAGLSLAYFLRERGEDYLLLEKSGKLGGLCSSVSMNGFTFDKGGHFLHFRAREIFDLVNNLMEGNLVRHERNAGIYMRGRVIPYPFQLGFYALPSWISAECSHGFLSARRGAKAIKRGSFLRWIQDSFGPGMAKHFMVPYNRKFWRMDLSRLSCGWEKDFVTVPSVSQVLAPESALKNKNVGYNAVFWYPDRGGIESLIDAFLVDEGSILRMAEVREVDLSSRILRLNSGQGVKFDSLVSTIPLPEFCTMINDFPPELKRASSRLKWLSLYNLNLGVRGKVFPGKHWIYFPGRKISFFRMGVFNNVSPNSAPPGGSSLYAEVSFLPASKNSRSDVRNKIKRDLCDAGVLEGVRDILCENSNVIDYAYPIYDKNYAVCRRKILSFLKRKKVICCGRYGGWRYLSMEGIMLESKEAAGAIHG